MEISIIVQNREYRDWMDRVTPFLETLVREIGVLQGEVAVVFCDDAFMMPLNEQYRRKEGTTDVLSFEDTEAAEERGGGFWGDIIISLPQVKENSRLFHVDEREELKRLLIHGMLHLMGEDHSSLEEDEPMLVKQEELLRRLENYILVEDHEIF